MKGRLGSCKYSQIKYCEYMEIKYHKGFRDLITWQEAKNLTVKIYELTKDFPKTEQFGLISQLRRASSSIMANLAEGSAMPTKAHRLAFYVRARGSVIEVENFMELVFALRYVSQDAYDDIVDHTTRLSYLITKLLQSQK